MLPCWLSKFKDAKFSSARSLSSDKARDDNAAALARCLSLQRANARAKSSRPDTVPSNQFDAHQLFERIDVLDVLSSGRETISPVKAILSSAKHEEFSSMSVSSPSERTDKGVDLLDRTLSSMSRSCSSDQDGVCGRERRVSPANAALFKSAPGAYQATLSEDEAGSLFRSLETDSSSSCEEPETTLRLVDCSCDFERLRQQRADGSFGCQEGSEWSSFTKAAGEQSQETVDASRPLPEAVVSESIVFVKNSYNPYEDFRESMYQMIMEKDLEESADVEELLDCYLNLNARELHDLIKEVFSDVWTEIVMRIR